MKFFVMARHVIRKTVLRRYHRAIRDSKYRLPVRGVRVLIFFISGEDRSVVGLHPIDSEPSRDHKMTIEDLKSPTMVIVSIIIRSIRRKPICSTQWGSEHEHGRMVSANHRPLHGRIIGKYSMAQMFGNGRPAV